MAVLRYNIMPSQVFFYVPPSDMMMDHDDDHDDDGDVMPTIDRC